MSCLLCPPEAESCRWCDPAPAQRLPVRFPAATATQAKRAGTGRFHPMGHRMPVLCERAAGETGGGCVHLARSENGSRTKVWLKCGLSAHTSGPATDTRARWPACNRWEPRA